MKEDREPEELEGGVQQLAWLELDSVTEGDTEQHQVKQEVHSQDGQNVELVSRVLVMQEVPGLAIGQPELITQMQTLNTELIKWFLESQIKLMSILPSMIDNCLRL